VKYPQRHNVEKIPSVKRLSGAAHERPVQISDAAMKLWAARQTRRSGKLARVGVARAFRANTESGGVNFHHPGNPSTTRASRRPSLQAIFQAISMCGSRGW
jgi:hypothetical protein